MAKNLRADTLLYIK